MRISDWSSDVCSSDLPCTHLISWRVASLDGHPVGGTFVFSIGAPTQPPAAGTLAEASASGWFVAGARYLLTLLLALGAGGAVFAATVDRNNGADRKSTRLNSSH